MTNLIKTSNPFEIGAYNIIDKHKHFIYVQSHRQNPQWKKGNQVIHPKSILKQINKNNLEHLTITYSNIEGEQRTKSVKVISIKKDKDIFIIEIHPVIGLDKNMYDVSCGFSRDKQSRSTFFWDTYNKKDLSSIPIVNAIVDGQTSLGQYARGECEACQEDNREDNREDNLLTTTHKINESLKRLEFEQKTKELERYFKKTLGNKWSKKRKRGSSRVATICQIAKIVKKMKKNYKFKLKCPKTGKTIYNPLADPRNQYYMGIYLCSHALASLEPCLSELCNNSIAAVVAPPQGF